MPSLIKRDGVWYAQYFDADRHPQRRRRSLKTKNKRDALRALARLEAEGFDPWREEQKRKPTTLRAAVDAFIARKKADGRSENTIRTYQDVLDQLLKTCTQLTSRSIERFVRAPSNKSTQHKLYGHVRTFVRWALREGLLSDDPLEGVTPPDKPQKLPKAITEEELEAICDAIRADYEEKRGKKPIREGELIWRIPMFWFSYYTGLRGSELARLRWEHIDFEKRLVYILKQKNKKEQTIPLNAKARAILEEVGPREEGYVFVSPRDEGDERHIRYFRENASRAFREARNKAGVRKVVSMHSLRHGFCTRLAESGKSAFVIQQAARHADISTSAKYVHMANEHLKRELDEVFGEA